jgi:iron(III) transport system ATP-binding protein
MNNAAVRCLNLSKSFDQTPAVVGLDLQVMQSEILAVVGPSGSGKTATLRLIAGFERPLTGEIWIGERLVATPDLLLPPEARGVGMVFQDYALFPHLTVFENIGFGLKGQPRKTARRTVRGMLALVGLEHLGERYPHELSGGERQRTALARALAPRPVLVLLDEPFSNLDAERRNAMREEVRAILKTSGATAIFVTHDQQEALFMGDRLAVFHRGRLEQIGTPEEVFQRPLTRFVADFMGETDLLPGLATPRGIHTEAGLIGQTVALPAGSPVEVALRADDLTFEADPAGECLVLARQFKGAMYLYRLRLPSGRLLHAFQPHTCTTRPGARVRVTIDPGHALACFRDGQRAESSLLIRDRLTA